MGFIKNNATTLKQVKIGTDTSKIHYIKRNGSIEWAKPYNLTISKGSGVNSVSAYRKSTKVSSGVTSGTSATLSSGNQVFHGDVLHIDATAATGYHITSGTGDITVKGAVTINPQVGRNQYKFKFEPRLINTSDDDAGLGYSTITDTSLNLTIPFGYDDNTQPAAVNTTINAVGGSKTVLYNGYLFFPQSLTSDSPVYNYYPEVKEANRIMYEFSPNTWLNNKTERVGASDITEPAYFIKLIGTTLTSHSPISMTIKTPYKISSVGSSDADSSAWPNGMTLTNGSSIVLWSDILTSDLNKLSGTEYTCEIPSNQAAAWTFDSTGNTSILTKEVTLASWTAASGFKDSDIPASAEIPTPAQRIYSAAINVESSINHVILDSADITNGYLFANIYGSWRPITSPTTSLSLPYGATIQFAKNHNSNMPGFTYNSDTVSETKNITVNGTSYTVDVYSKTYTVNANNMNIPFYVTPNSYTITCNVGTGIRAFNFSTVSKYGTSHENNTYGGGSFTVYYKDTCSYSGLVDTGFENPVPSATNEPVSTKTITFTASPKLFRVTVSMGNATGITATFDRTSSPYKGAATGKLTDGYDNNYIPLANSGGITFGNGWSFDAYYGDVFTCTPTFKVTTPTNASLTMQTKYINYTSSRTISEATTWSITPKESNITVYFTNTKFFNSDSQYLKYCRHGTYTSSPTFSAGTNNNYITIDAGTPVYMYTCCRRNQNPGNSSNIVTNLGSNNPGAYVGTCYSQYSTSLTMSSFSKITALPYNNDYIEVVPAQKKESGEFYLTLAPIIKMFTRGYGIAGTSGSTATNVTVYEYQYSGSSMTGQYKVPHQEVAEVHQNVTNYTTCITTMAVLHSGTTRLGAKWSVYSGVAGKVSFDNSPANFINFKTFDELLFKNDDRNIPDGTVVTYGPYASVKIKPYLDTYYYSWGWKYALYHGTERTFRTYRRKYDGTSNLPSMGYNASGSGSVSNLGTYLYYSGPTESIPTVRGYLEPGGGSSMYDDTSVSLSRRTFLSSSTGSDPNKYSLSGTKSYAILDFNSTSNKIESKLKAVLDDKLVIDYVYDYKTNNY